MGLSALGIQAFRHPGTQQILFQGDEHKFGMGEAAYDLSNRKLINDVIYHLGMEIRHLGTRDRNIMAKTTRWVYQRPLKVDTSSPINPKGTSLAVTLAS